ncbi:type IV fimbrial biogenesis protein FimT [Marinobacterium halophilum]|uniref:Type II secretion system protein H n=1 Tax=Marinobacterium halophilum TaxID=267374 RepID=A0A2P8F2C7_9GAMM|nr:GspH/FimT family protein [Marinobacterium halophilum]PSL15856.1 type IV fimbrial biogenesis protein FimT [Marinobacterium halophilum]
MPESAGNCHEQGLTLIELLIVLLIVGILSSIALPSFVNQIERGRIEAATDDLVSALRLARSEAIQQNARVLVVGADGGGNPDADRNYANGWAVRLQDAEGVVDDADELLRVYEGFPEGVACAACSGEVVFNGMGEAITNSLSLQLLDGDETECINLSRSGGVITGC